METFSIKSLFGTRINQLWDNDKYKSVPMRERGYAVQDHIIKDALMFIGLNPSYQDESPERIFYDNNNEKTHPYFSKFKDVQEKTNINILWTHLDLFYIREKRQVNILQLCENKSSINGYDFLKEQYLISKEIIELARPRIIIVNNTHAREWMKNEKLNNDCFRYKFDNTIGTYKIQQDSPLNNTPVFFTSMLTGQRALDLGSYERLIWHINFVHKALKSL